MTVIDFTAKNIMLNTVYATDTVHGPYVRQLYLKWLNTSNFF